LEKLLQGLMAWRDRTAMELKLSPFHVLPDHIARNLAYSRPTALEALQQCGVRVRSSELLAVIQDLGQQHGLSVAAGMEPETDNENSYMVFPSGAVKPANKWEHAIYKAPKGKLPPWEYSWERFGKGEHPEAIAANQPNGKPVQTSTVFGHLLEALVQGRAVDLCRLAEVKAPPVKSDWEKMEHVVAVEGVSIGSPDFKAKDLLRAILGEKVDMEPASKTEAARLEESTWYDKIRYFQTLKRAAIPVSFGETPSKRQRVA